MDLTRPLLSKYAIKGRKYFIEYEICFKCVKYGHYVEGCTERGVVSDPVSNVNREVRGKDDRGAKI